MLKGEKKMFPRAVTGYTVHVNRPCWPESRLNCSVMSVGELKIAFCFGVKSRSWHFFTHASANKPPATRVLYLQEEVLPEQQAQLRPHSLATHVALLSRQLTADAQLQRVLLVNRKGRDQAFIAAPRSKRKCDEGEFYRPSTGAFVSIFLWKRFVAGLAVTFGREKPVWPQLAQAEWRNASAHVQGWGAHLHLQHACSKLSTNTTRSCAVLICCAVGGQALTRARSFSARGEPKYCKNFFSN